jgi:hypothetical protein
MAAADDEQETPVTGFTVRSFDPEGSDRVENEDRAALAADAKPETTWRTDRYNNRELGGLKEGVGLVLELPEAEELRHVRVSSPSSGWSASIYVADRSGASLADWGPADATLDDIGGTADFELDGDRGRAVLIWITRLGADNRVEIAEVAVQR